MLDDKLQKITEALYRVTELYPDKEPLKWQLRTNAIELFDFLFSNEEKEIFDVKKAFDLISRLTRFLQLAYASSAFVSSINFEVLRREYLSLSESLEAQMESKKQELLSLPNLLLPTFTSPGLVKSIGQNVDSNGQIIDSNGQERKEPLGSQASKSVSKGGSEAGALLPPKANGQPVLLKERKRRILALLENNGNGNREWLTIREISSSLPEYGGKSIQRDLLGMVEAGILRKAGDKRWRKYSLV